jgi:hypothetical protein
MVIKKILLGDDLWSEDLKNSIRQSYHYRTIQTWLKKGTNVPMEATPYYEFMAKVSSQGLWGSIIKNRQDAVNQYQRFKKLYEAYPNWDPIEYTKSVINGVDYYYGGIMVKIGNSGTLCIWDGHHRAAVLLALNKPIELDICSYEPGWLKFKNELKMLYPTIMYQPIPHPCFNDWNKNENKLKEGVVRDIISTHGFKRVLELGSCHGYLMYQARDLLKFVLGVEMDPIRFKVLQLVYSKIGFTRYNPIEKFNLLLDTIKRTSKTLVYELPNSSESQYSWMYEGIDMHALIGTRYKNRTCYSIGLREIYVLTD